jgi:hypothetical protein
MVELDPPELDAAVLLASSDARYQEVVDLVRAKHWKKARKALEGLVTAEDTQHRYDRFVAGKALSARLAELDGDDKAARGAYASVLAAWSDPDKAAARITDEASGEGEQETNRRLAGALIGVGAATYAGAEHAREAAAKIVFPAFGGPRTKDAVLAFVNKKVAPWLSSKRDAIEKAEQSYQHVLEIRPAPPPRWVVASAERVGTMWMGFVDDFTKSPQPKEWDSMPEIVEAYRDSVQAMSDPLRARARAAYEACVNYSDKFRIEDDHTRICRAALRPKP